MGGIVRTGRTVGIGGIDGVGFSFFLAKWDRGACGCFWYGG